MRTTLPFHIGRQYTRPQVCQLLGVPEDARGGDWNTGYHRHDGEWFIFTNVGSAGRTGHDYGNQWLEGNDLLWFGKGGTRRGQPAIESLIASSPLIFTRESDREPFTFEGLGHAVEIKDTTPVKVRWRLLPTPEVPAETMPAEVLAVNGEVFREGAVRQVLVNAVERNPAARRRCIAHWGCGCAVCGFDFGRSYGPLGQGFIEVHHLDPLALIAGEREVDPISDLRPVCGNCHAMLHRRSPPLTIDELRQLIEAVL